MNKLVINELTLLNILLFLARHYPDRLSTEAIIRALGFDRQTDVRKCLFYLREKDYIIADMEADFWLTGGRTEVSTGHVTLTAAGIDYLDKYNKELADGEEIKRKRAGF